MQPRRKNRPVPSGESNEHRDWRMCESSSTHEDYGIQAFIVFLRGVAVVLVGFMLEVIVELDAGGAVSPEEGGRDGNCLSRG